MKRYVVFFVLALAVPSIVTIWAELTFGQRGDLIRAPTIVEADALILRDGKGRQWRVAVNGAGDLTTSKVDQNHPHWRIRQRAIPGWTPRRPQQNPPRLPLRAGPP